MYQHQLKGCDYNAIQSCFTLAVATYSKSLKRSVSNTMNYAFGFWNVTNQIWIDNNVLSHWKSNGAQHPNTQGYKVQICKLALFILSQIFTFYALISHWLCGYVSVGKFEGECLIFLKNKNTSWKNKTKKSQFPFGSFWNPRGGGLDFSKMSGL